MKYYYIDDHADAARSFALGFSQNDIFVEIIPINNFEEAISNLVSKNDIEGLILDHKLEEFSTPNGGNLSFRGTSIAQEIRNRQKSTEQAYKVKEYPIFLLSATDNILRLLDTTGEDLFDIIISKDELKTTTYIDYITKMKACSSAYARIRKDNGNINKILNIEISKINFQFSEFYDENLRIKPIHEIAMFLLRQLILKRGLLIDELTLAARFGIDKSASSDWDNLKEIIIHSKYSGAYSDAYDRWWMSLLNIWWQEISPKSLRILTSEERIKVIADKYQLKELYPIKPLPRAKSPYYWTICKGLDYPIDEMDGVIIANQSNLYSWQEPDYVSIEEALKRTNISKWKALSPISKMQIEELIETLDNEPK